jgi:hypothetical protein
MISRSLAPDTPLEGLRVPLEKLAIWGSIRAMGVRAGACFFSSGSFAFFAGAVRTCLRFGRVGSLFFFVTASGLTGAAELSVVSGPGAGATRIGVVLVVREVVVGGFGAEALVFGFVGAFVVVVVVAVLFGAGAGLGAGSGFGLVAVVVVGVTSVVSPVVVGGGSSPMAGAASVGSVAPSAKSATNRPACAALTRARPSSLLTYAPNAMSNQVAM